MRFFDATGAIVWLGGVGNGLKKEMEGGKSVGWDVSWIVNLAVWLWREGDFAYLYGCWSKTGSRLVIPNCSFGRNNPGGAMRQRLKRPGHGID